MEILVLHAVQVDDGDFLRISAEGRKQGLQARTAGRAKQPRDLRAEYQIAHQAKGLVGRALQSGKVNQPMVDGHCEFHRYKSRLDFLRCHWTTRGFGSSTRQECEGWYTP